MNYFKLPWACWYEDKEIKLDVPDNWNMKIYNLKKGKSLNNEDIKKALLNPIDSEKLRTLADGKENAIILSDDLSRDTPVYRIIPYVIEELHLAGIKDEKITILIATGAHRPLVRDDLIKKLGIEIVNNYRIINHNTYYNNTYMGSSSRGTPIYINKFFIQADIRIGIGSIIPHSNAGFSGGGKIVVPGCAGIETLKANHQGIIRGLTGGINEVDKNDNRLDIEEIAYKAGLDFVVNIVPNSNHEVAGVFAGDLVGAHRKGVLLAREIFTTKINNQADVGIFNAYPKDTEFLQCVNSLNVYFSSKRDLLKKNGIIIITTVSSEGRGIHTLHGLGMPLYLHFETQYPALKKILKSKKLIIFSPNINDNDKLFYYSKETKLANSWDEVILKVQKHFAFHSIKVNVFPFGPLQLST